MRLVSAAGGIALVFCLSLAVSLPAQNPPPSMDQHSDSPARFLADFEKRVTVKVLPNGLTLIVCERPEAPVFSYFTIVDAGDANDPGGQQHQSANGRKAQTPALFEVRLGDHPVNAFLAID